MIKLDPGPKTRGREGVIADNSGAVKFADFTNGQIKEDSAYVVRHAVFKKSKLIFTSNTALVPTPNFDVPQDIR